MNKYKWKDCELVPTVCSDLIITLFMNKTFTREEAIKQIVEYHLANGGKCLKPSYIKCFKNSTQYLRKQGYNLQNPIVGTWKLEGTQQNCNTNHDNECLEIGQGSEIVYVYYYPAYKQLALYEGQDYWYCKVGRTSRNLFDRIYAQSTGLPEKPIVALVINCDNSTAVESVIHKILTLNGREVTDAPGKEWYLTSPEEVKTLYEQNQLK